MPFSGLLEALRESAPQRRREREATIADNYRRALKLPDDAEDCEIIALWHEMAGFEESDIEKAMIEAFGTWTPELWS